jgi:hypothetical protein
MVDREARMGIRVPRPVAAVAADLGLGHLRRRFHGAVPLHTYFGVTLSAGFLFCLIVGGPWLLLTLLALAGGSLLAYAIATRINTAAYLYDGGLVQVGPNRKIKAAARWADVMSTGASHYAVSTGGPSVHHVTYTVRLTGDRFAEFRNQYLRDADELYDAIVDAHREHRRQAGS